MSEVQIKDFKDKDTVESLFLVKERNIAVGKNGRTFMTLLLGDASGQMDGRLWDNVEATAREFEVGDVIKAKGQVQIFQNRRQFIVHRLEKVDPSTINFEDFVPKSSRNAEDLYIELLNCARGMKNDSLRQLTLDVLEDPELRPMILKAPRREIDPSRLDGWTVRTHIINHKNHGVFGDSVPLS